MSETIIYGIKDGKVSISESVRNSHRSAPAIWGILSDKYLNQQFSLFLYDSVQKVWNLYKNKDVDINHRVVLGATFDYGYILKEDLDALIKAMNKFVIDLDKDNKTSLVEQIEILESYRGKDIDYVVFEQTSTSGCPHLIYDEELDEYIIDKGIKENQFNVLECVV